MPLTGDEPSTGLPTVGIGGFTTSITFWLTDGIDPKTVQTWLGHALTVDLYLPWMGSSADGAAISPVGERFWRSKHLEPGNGGRSAERQDPRISAELRGAT